MILSCLPVSYFPALLLEGRGLGVNFDTANTRARGRFEPVVLGTGEVPFRAIFRYLRESGYNGPVSIEEAGIEPEPLDMLDCPEERLDRVLAVNLKGPYFLSQQAARWMIRLRGEGIVPTPRIVFITSVQAYMANPTGAEYCLSKAALHMAVKAFAARLGASGIPVFEVSPGIIESDMSLVHKEAIDRMIASGRLPTARWGKPVEVAAVVAAIVRGDLDYSTGSTIEVGGGLGLRRL